MSDCTDCPINYFCPDVAATSVDTVNDICEAGFTCAAGSQHGRVTICPLGEYCPQSSTVAIACVAPEEYQDQMGSTACLRCPAGYYCDQTSKTRCEPQNEGPQI